MTPSVRWAFGSFFFLYFAYVGLVSPDYLSNRIGIIRFCACLASITFLAIFYLHSYIAFFVWMFVLHTILSSLMPLGESATVHL